jgi:hypothetical protein
MDECLSIVVHGQCRENDYTIRVDSLHRKKRIVLSQGKGHGVGIACETVCSTDQRDVRMRAAPADADSVRL